MQGLQLLRPIAERQHGLVTTRQAERAGVRRGAWRGLVAVGVLDDLGHGVGRLIGAPETPLQRISRGVLSTRGRAVASHASAAYLWGGLERLPEGPVDVLAYRSGHGRGTTVCRVHRPVDWIDVGTAEVQGIPVVHPVRALIDLGATAPGLVKFAVERMIIQGVVTRHGLERAVEHHARQGRHGITAVRRVLDDWSFGDVPPDSVLEVRFAELLRRRGLPPATFHHPVLSYVVDAAWPDQQVAAECDGWDKYSIKTQFERQFRRDAALRGVGWTVVHFTWDDVVRRPGYVAHTIRQLLGPQVAR